MRRLLIIFTAAAMLAGCKIEEGQNFEPTKIGFTLATNFNSSAYKDIGYIATLWAFRGYLQAETDEERTAIQDRYFYNSRIVKRDDYTWQIIAGSTLTVQTNDNTLAEAGDLWRMTRGTDNENYTTTITLLDTPEGEPERFSFESKYIYYSQRNHMETECTVSKEEDKAGFRIELLSGSGLYFRRNDSYYRFQIITPLECSYNGGDRAIFDKGRIKFSYNSSDLLYTPEVEYCDEFTFIVYGGKENAYEKSYSWYGNWWWY